MDYHVGDWVWLEAKTRDGQPLVKTTHPMAKLDSKRFGPFKITAIVGQAAYRLDIPVAWKCKGKHDIYHETYLSPHHGPVFPSTIVQPEVIEGEEVFEVERILDSKRVG